MPDEKTVSRRGFIGAALVGSMGIAASSVLAGCSAPASTGGSNDAATASWDEETDVVVIGAGGAGYAAAIEAANAGSSVLLLEKTNILGGDSALCDGILGAAESRLAKELGIDVTKDDVYEWFMAHPEWSGPKNTEVARVNADQGGATIDWLEELGAPFVQKVTPRFGYTELAVIHQIEGKGGEMVRVLSESADKAGVETMKETPVSELLTNEEGRVIGVVATSNKGEMRIKAKKGVVMATGSYSGSPAVLGTINPEAVNVQPGSNPGATGDGLAMGISVGAFMSRVTDIPLLSSLVGRDTGSVVNWNYYERLHGLWLDANGERFFDEETPYENPMGHRAILRKHKEQGKPVVALVSKTPELEGILAVRPLKWATADTVEEVAQMVGLDPAKVKATVDRYNGF
ncbi:MAG: FAD-dependent oxidoreductase, partial [Raoultibacter sp.]